jgi:DsbC/DsbD-like thiol-disulfide interchange protein
MVPSLSLRSVLLVGSVALVVAPAWADGLSSAWSEGKSETKARLIAGRAADGGGLMAAVEIGLADGWKTYWRFPGDAGGVPPTFDWEKSDNVASAKVLYPVPARMTDKAGDALGYKGNVVFPVRVVPKDPTKPVRLELTLEYGICKEVCVPVEAALSLPVPAGDATAVPANVAAALKSVPRAAEQREVKDPKFIKAEVKLEGAKPTITIEAEFPGGTAKADAFVESPNGYYIPLPKLGSGVDAGKDRLRFEIDLTGAVEPGDIKGKSAIVTLVSPDGASEATFKLE